MRDVLGDSFNFPFKVFKHYTKKGIKFFKEKTLKLINEPYQLIDFNNKSSNEDLSFISSFIFNRKACLVYQLGILFLLLQYFFSFKGLYPLERIIFCILFLNAMVKAFWFLPDLNIGEFRIWIIFDCFISLLMNIWINYSNPLNCCLINCFLFLSICFLSSCILFNIFVAILFFLIYSILEGTFFGCGIIFLGFCFACMAISIVNNDIVSECTRRYYVLRKKTENEILNKTLFVASVSHDLKNPLNSLLGSIDMLRNSADLKYKDKKHLATATFSGQILSFLVGNILDISKIETGKFELDCVPMSIADEVKKILKIESELSKSKGIPLYKKVVSPLPKTVFGDPMRFAQILMNLTGNAIKFTSQGYVALVIQWTCTAGEIKSSETLQSMCFRGGNEDLDLIPPEEFFLSCPRKNAQSEILHENRICSSSHLKNNNSYQPTESLKDVDEVVDEDANEYVSNKMAKYLELPKSKGGKYSVETLLARRKSLFNEISPIPCALGENSNSVRRQEDTFSPLCCLPGSRRGSNSHRDISSGLILQAFRKRSECRDITNNEMDNMNGYEVEYCGSENGILIIDIIDTGPGMTQEEIKKLFKPFMQANENVKAKFGGTGLGLWITKQLVHLMNGLIEIRSIPKKGTRFRIAIPMQKVKNEFSLSPRVFLETVAEGRRADSKTNLIQFIAGDSGGLRVKGKMKFKGNNEVLKGMRFLLIENENIHVDSQIEQIINQLKQTNCELIYTTYAACLETLIKHELKFNSLILIGTTPTEKTKKILKEIMKFLEEKENNKIQVLLASGKIKQNKL